MCFRIPENSFLAKNDKYKYSNLLIKRFVGDITNLRIPTNHEVKNMVLDEIEEDDEEKWDEDDEDW